MMKSEKAGGTRFCNSSTMLDVSQYEKKHKLITTLWFSKVENDHAKNS